MIVVDIEVPGLNRVYDFELDEEIPMGELADGITGVILQSEKLKMEKEEQKRIQLYSLRQERVLHEDMNLKQQGIDSGDRLVLL